MGAANLAYTALAAQEAHRPIAFIVNYWANQIYVLH